MNLPLENYLPPYRASPPENENFLNSPSYGKPSLKMKIFWPPPNSSNSLDLQFLLISMSLCWFLQILERALLHMAAQFNRSSNHKL